MSTKYRNTKYRHRENPEKSPEVDSCYHRQNSTLCRLIRSNTPRHVQQTALPDNNPPHLTQGNVYSFYCMHLLTNALARTETLSIIYCYT